MDGRVVAPNIGGGVVAPSRRPNPNAQDEQTQFMQQAINSNILLKRDADAFYGNDSKENAANFVRNYNEFYRGYAARS